MSRQVVLSPPESPAAAGGQARPPVGPAAPTDSQDRLNMYMYQGEHLGRVSSSKIVDFDLNKGKKAAPEIKVKAQLQAHLDIVRDPQSKSRIGCHLKHFLDVPIEGSGSTTLESGRIASWLLLKPSKSLPCEDIEPGLWMKEWVKRSQPPGDKHGLRREMIYDLRAIFDKKSGKIIRTDNEDDGSVLARVCGVHDGDNLIYIQIIRIEEPIHNKHCLQVTGQGLLKHVLELYLQSFTSPIFQEHFTLFGPTAFILEPGLLNDRQSKAHWNAQVCTELPEEKREKEILKQLIKIYGKNGFKHFGHNILVEEKKGVWTAKTIMGYRRDLKVAVNGQSFGAVTELDSTFPDDLGTCADPAAAPSSHTVHQPVHMTTPPKVQGTWTSVESQAKREAKRKSEESEEVILDCIIVSTS